MLQRCLSAFRELTYPKDKFEIIVVNDGGPDCHETTASFHQDLRLRIMTQENAGPAAARNHGATLAEGRFLAFTDDDCAPHPEWLLHLEKTLLESEPCVAGGKTVNALSDNPYSATSQRILDVVYGYYNADPKAARFFASNNIACPAELFRTIGGFNRTFRTSEDREFCDRCLRAGFKLSYAPDAVIFHSHALDLKGLWIQHYHYGKGAFHYHSARKQAGATGLQIEKEFYRKLLISPFRDSIRSRWKSLLLLLSSQTANAFGYFAARLNRR